MGCKVGRCSCPALVWNNANGEMVLKLVSDGPREVEETAGLAVADPGTAPAALADPAFVCAGVVWRPRRSFVLGTREIIASECGNGWDLDGMCWCGWFGGVLAESSPAGAFCISVCTQPVPVFLCESKGMAGLKNVIENSEVKC